MIKQITFSAFCDAFRDMDRNENFSYAGKRALFDFLGRLADERLDLLGRFGRALGQAAHLAGHHGKTTALFARACSLNGRVQCEDVGLERDAFDHPRDVRHLA